MATIYQRGDKGKWRLQIRRAGLPSLSICFDSHKEAMDWAKANEASFTKCPNFYMKWYGNGMEAKLRRMRGMEEEKIIDPQIIMEAHESFKTIVDKYFSQGVPTEEDIDRAKQEMLEVSQEMGRRSMKQKE